MCEIVKIPVIRFSLQFADLNQKFLVIANFVHFRLYRKIKTKESYSILIRARNKFLFLKSV